MQHQRNRPHYVNCLILQIIIVELRFSEKMLQQSIRDSLCISGSFLCWKLLSVCYRTLTTLTIIDALGRDKKQHEKELSILMTVLGQQALNEHNPPEIRNSAVRDMRVAFLRAMCADFLNQ